MAGGRLYSPPTIGAPGKRAARRRYRDLALAGLFVLFMLALLLGAVLWLSGLPGKSYPVVTHFPFADGLERGTRVFQSGYVIGRVGRVQPLFPATAQETPASPCGSPDRLDPACPSASSPGPWTPCFRVELEISRDWRLADDSRAFIGSESLLKGDVVKIQPGLAETVVEAGGELRGCGREPDLTSQLTNLTEFLQQLIEETVGPILASLNRQVQALEGLLVGGGEEGAETRQDVAGILENMRIMSEDLKRQVAAVDPRRIGEIVDSAQAVAGDVEAITASFDQRTGAIERTLEDFSALARDLKNLVRTNRTAVSRSLTDTQYLLQELATALTPLLNNIEEASRNLLELSRDLRDNPAVLLRGRELEDNAPRR